MPTTISNIVPTRRVAVGESATAQGRDGVSELTRTALSALASSDWTVSADAPSIPVHDYDRPVPTGDAWKACYGYDAAARTERGACGAVCYTFAVPADALAGTACNIVSIGLRVQGDRYLDKGVNVHVIASASATPPAVGTLRTRTPEESGVCATETQTEPPNARTGVVATLTIPVGSAATAYIHVALLLTDYLGARGAWIEGGAMLVGGAVSINFSRSVTTDSPITYDLDLGPTDQTASGIGRQEIIAAPRANLIYTAKPFNGSGAMVPVSALANPSAEAVALLLSPSASTATIDGTAALANWTAEYLVDYATPPFYVRYCTYSDGSADKLQPTIVAIVRSGIVPDGDYHMLALYPISNACPIPVRIAAYGLARAPYHLKPGATLFNSSFWQGGVSQISAISAVDAGQQEVAASKFQQFAPAPTTSVACKLLATARVEAGEATPRTLPIEWTVATGGAPVAVLVAIRPDVGASTLSGAELLVPSNLAIGLRP